MSVQVISMLPSLSAVTFCSSSLTVTISMSLPFSVFRVVEVFSSAKAEAISRKICAVVKPFSAALPRSTVTFSSGEVEPTPSLAVSTPSMLRSFSAMSTAVACNCRRSSPQRVICTLPSPSNVLMDEEASALTVIVPSMSSLLSISLPISLPRLVNSLLSTP